MTRLLPALLCALALASPAAAQEPALLRSVPADATDGVHGMLLFGAGPVVYVSHLPLWSAPHDWQLVFEARLSSDGATSVPDASALYAADRRSSGEPVYTIEPERFPLRRLAEATERDTVRFRATLYRGHFERGGAEIARGVIVTLARPIVRKRADAAAADPAPQSWRIFGRGELFLVREVGGAPDFDQVVRVRKPPRGLRAADLARGVRVVLPRLPAETPLRGAEEVTFRLAGTRRGGTVEVGEVVYTETGDLAKP